MTPKHDAITVQAQDIGSRFEEHPTDTVTRFVQYAISLADLKEPEGVHPVDVMHEAARLSVIDTAGIDQVDEMVPALLGDEALCREILVARQAIG